MRALRFLVLGLLATSLLSGCFIVAVGGAAVGAAHDRRAFNTIVDDRNIQLSAYDNLNKDKELALKNNVGIVVYDGSMLLIGEVNTDELKRRAEARTSGFEGVRRVVNEIEVREPEGFWSRRRDNSISAHVKTALLDIRDLPGFDPTRVNVSTAHRVVYLMGLVSREEAERTVEIARNVAGVERVVKVFEYGESSN
jgi:osmotically-inducible protein OsmY